MVPLLCICFCCVLSVASSFQALPPGNSKNVRSFPQQQQQTTPCAVTLQAVDGAGGGGGGDDLMMLYDNTNLLSVPLLLVVALGVGIAAQSFINQMLEGEDGLGAFLSDGSGYNKSGFKQQQKRKSANNEADDDPLPWLKLPELDFVDVAGQIPKQKYQSISEVMDQLESLRLEMNQAVKQGRMEEAETMRKELERIMDTYDIEYKK